MNFERTLERTKMKKDRKNRDLAKAWRKKRIDEIGLIAYMNEYNRTTKSHLDPRSVYEYVSTM